MQFFSFLRSSATAWSVAGVAVLTCCAVAGRTNLARPTSVEIFRLKNGSADPHAAIKRNKGFRQPLVANAPSFLTSAEMVSSLGGSGIVFNPAQSITLTPYQPFATLPGSNSTVASLMIEASTLSDLEPGGFIDIPAPAASYDISQLDVMFVPTKPNVGYYVEIDFEPGGPLSSVTVEPIGGTAQQLAVKSNQKSVHLVVVSPASGSVQLMITPHGGDIGVKAVKITGF
jgi:hypothetical protein